MRIAGWHIDGFGIFSDYAIPELSDGLTVLAGPNEAGKSTLLAYIRGMLFGFPDKRHHQPLYAPVHGGRHGGRLFLLGNDGRYVVERQAGTARKTVVVTLPDGSRGSEDDLAHLLGNADAALFETVFAFTLRELQELDSLTKSGEAADRVFSAGLVGAGKSAQKVVRDLGDVAGDVYKRQGRGGALRETLEELNRTESLLTQVREAATGYPRLAAQLGEADREVRELDAQATALRDKIARLHSLQKLWPAWSELLEAEGELQALGDEKIDEEVLDGLVSDLALHRERLSRLPSLAAGVLQAAAELDARLADLGPGWNSEQLAALDVSLPTRDVVRDWERRLREAGEATTEAQRRLQKAEDARGTLLRERERLPPQVDVPTTGTTASVLPVARWLLAATAIGGVAVGAVLMAAGSMVAGVVVLVAALLLGVAAAVIVTRVHGDRRVARAEQHRTRTELASVDARLQEAKNMLADETTTLKAAQEEEEAIDLEWAAWKSDKGVPVALSPQGVVDFFASVEQARGVQRTLTSITSEQGQTQRLVADWEDHARAVAAPGTDLGGEHLAARVEQSGTTHRRRRELQARVAGLLRTLAGEAREGEPVEDLRAVLAEGEPTTWADEEELLTTQLRDLSSARDAAVEKRRDAQTALAALEQSADVAARDARRESLIADLDQIVHDWRRARLAQVLLASTLQQYVKEHQPRVLAEASRLFAGVTGSRYERVVRQGDGNELTILQRDGTAKPTIDLSRGTAEQLYLCLRLSLAAEFASRGTALPLVMDDVLVDFDPRRAAAIAAALAEVARERQVLLFTCHPGTRDLIVTAAGDQATVIELPAPVC